MDEEQYTRLVNTARVMLIVFLGIIVVDYFVNYVVQSYRVIGNVPEFITYTLQLKRLRYRGKRSLPVLLFWIYLMKPKFYSKLANNIIDFIAILPIPVALAASVGFFKNEFFLEYTGLGWQYIAVVEWSIAFVAIYWFVRDRLKNRFAALNVATNLVFAAGWVHEILLYYPLKLFIHPSHILGIHTQIISIVFTLFFLRHYRVDLRRQDIMVLLGFIFYSVFIDGYVHGIDYRLKYVLKGLVQTTIRLPVIAVIITLARRLRLPKEELPSFSLQ